MQQLWQYLLYYLKAKNAHGLHSPFVYQLYTQVVGANKYYKAFGEAEALRKAMQNNPEKIKVHDLGAGSKVFKSDERSISQLAKHSSSPAKVGKLLFKLIDEFQPKTIFELGTNLGLTTFYLAKAAPLDAEIYTFEGCSNLLKLSKLHLKKWTNNVHFVGGNLANSLAQQVAQVERLDFVFFDANHQQQATLDYFETCLEKAHNDSIFVFDDIHWSTGMEAAWKEIQAHPQVKLSVDLYALGLVFFKKELTKEHFLLRF